MIWREKNNKTSGVGKARPGGEDKNGKLIMLLRKRKAEKKRTARFCHRDMSFAEAEMCRKPRLGRACGL